MSGIALRARVLFTGDQRLKDQWVLIEQGKVRAIRPVRSARVPRGFVPSRRAYWVLPGLIDLHAHGGGTGDPNTVKGLLASANYHAHQGTTAWMRTVLYPGLDALAVQARNVRAARARATLHLLGLHLEGPFLNPKVRGSIPARSLRPPSLALARQIVAACQGELRWITLSPELPGAEAIIRCFKRAGVVVSLGHSWATWTQTERAVKAGARHITHLGNAMRPFHQREPGILGAALLDPRLSVELIADGQHLSTGTIQLFLRAKQGQAVLVSDCRSTSGEGLRAEGGAVRLPSGRLAGGQYALWHGLKVLSRLPGHELLEAVQRTSTGPAALLGRRDLGRIGPGADADLVLTGSDLKVDRVLVAGEQVSGPQDQI